MSYKAAFFLFVLFCHASSQQTTRNTIQSLIKSAIKCLPKVNTGTTNICPIIDLPRCPCGCGNPTKCSGPLINTLSFKPTCNCGQNGCQCNLVAYYEKESPVCLKPVNILQSLGLSYDVKPCGCTGPCQCRMGPVYPVQNAEVPTFRPLYTEAYYTPDLSMYQVPIDTPTFLTPVEFLQFPKCDCPSLESCSCGNRLISYEILAPNQDISVQNFRLCRCGSMNSDCGCFKTECQCPKNACQCPKNACQCPKNACQCPKNTCQCPKNSCTCPDNAVVIFELPISNMAALNCQCGRPFCDCVSSPLAPANSGKYLRQVTIQPPFL